MDNIKNLNCVNLSNTDTDSNKIYKQNEKRDEIVCKYVSEDEIDCLDKNDTPAIDKNEDSIRESKNVSDDLLTIKTNHINDSEDSYSIENVCCNEKEIGPTIYKPKVSDDSNTNNSCKSKGHTKTYLKWQEIESDSDDVIPPTVKNSTANETQFIEISDNGLKNNHNNGPSKDFVVPKESADNLEVEETETIQISDKDSEIPIISDDDLNVESIDRDDNNKLQTTESNEPKLQKEPETSPDSKQDASASEEPQRIATSLISSSMSTIQLGEDNLVEKEDVGKEGKGDGGDKKESESADKQQELDDDKDDDDCDSGDDDDDSEKVMSRDDKMKEIKRKMAIKKLTYLVEKLNKRIHRLEEQELSLDDMKSDSVYTQLELYKKKLVTVWKQLCKLTDQAPTMERETEKPFVFRGTNYPQINKAISRFVNKYQSFPDYQDIFDLVTTCNEFCKMELSKQMLSSISMSAFTDVGKALKQRRIRDYKDNFGSHLTDQSEALKDPAMEDLDLRKKLEDNRRKADTNLEKTFHHFESLPPKESEESDDDDDDEDDKSDDDDDDDDDDDRKKEESKNSDLKKTEKDDDSLDEEIPSEKITIAEAGPSVDESDSDDDDDHIQKKSLSTLYDSKTKPKNKINERKSKESVVKDSDGSERELGNNSSRNVNNCGMNLRSGKSEVKENESLRLSKRKSDRSSLENPKRQKMAADVEEPRPMFVRLVDEIVTFKASGLISPTKKKSTTNNSWLDDISKALSPSKVVLKNCMSCKVLCRKSDYDSSSKDEGTQKSSSSKKRKSSSDSSRSIKKAAQDTLPDSDPQKDKTTTDVTNTKSSSNSAEKQNRARSEENDRKGSSKLFKQTRLTDPEQCVTLSDSDDGKEGETSSSYKVVGEVLTFQEHYDDDGLVMAVTSLRKEDIIQIEGDKPTKIGKEDPKSSTNVPPRSPAAPDVVIVDDSNFTNEDGIIFIGSYSPPPASNGVTTSQPKQINHPSTQSYDPARMVDSAPGMNCNYAPTHRPQSKKIMLAQRKTVKKAAPSCPIKSATNCRMTSPPQDCPSTSMVDSSGLTGINSQLLARLFDPTVPTTDVPKLPAKVVKQIKNITKKITSRGRGGKVMTSPRSKPFPGFVTKHRPYFAAGPAYAMANANLMARTSKPPKRKLQFPGEPPSGAFNPSMLSPSKNRRMARHSMRGNKCRAGLPRGGVYVQDAITETVIIDDDDSNLQDQVPNQSHVDTVAQQANPIRPTPRTSYKINNNRTPVKNRIPENLNPQTSSQRKFQQKTHSNSSDVILCGVSDYAESSKIADSNPPKRKRNMAPHSSRMCGNVSKNVNKVSCLETLGSLGIPISVMSSPRRENSVAKSSHSTTGNISRPPISSTRILKIKTVSNDSDVILCDDLSTDRVEHETPSTTNTTTNVIASRSSNMESNPKVVSSLHNSLVTPPSDDDRIPYNDNDAIILLD